jgi:hypothetical protein
MGDPISKPLNEHYVLHRQLLKLTCPNIAKEKVEQSAMEAQRAIVENFIEPAARRKFRTTLKAERMYAGSTEAIDLNYLVIRIREMEMDERYRPVGDLSLSEETARILRAGEAQWTSEYTDEDHESDEEGEIHAGLVFAGCFRCGFVGHRAMNCPTYKELVRAKCSKCLEKNVSLCHRPEECKGHTAESIREQVDQDAARKSKRRGAGYGPTRGNPFTAKNVREA